MSEPLRILLSPPREDERQVRAVWSVLVSTLGPYCQEVWLRFGLLEDLKVMVPPGQYRQLEKLVGRYWGVPDPAEPPEPPDTSQSVLGSLLADLTNDFRQAGFTENVQIPYQKYIPYGFAVVPAVPALTELLAVLEPTGGNQLREVISRLADHWHFRCDGRDIMTTSDLSYVQLNLLPDEATALRSAFDEAGLSLDLLTHTT